MIILTYHTVRDVKNFEEQVRYLVAGKFTILSLQDFRDRFANKTLKSNDVLITFDDGDYSVLENALPVLSNYGCSAVLFVITGLIGTKQPFWWDEILYYTHDRKKVIAAKLMSNSARLDFLQTLRDTNSQPRMEYRQLTLEELTLLKKKGIAIASHSHTHPLMDTLSAGEIMKELSESSNYLKRNGFPDHDVFAYPNGNHTPESEQVLTNLSIRFGFLFNHELVRELGSPLRISRLSVNDATPLWKFKLILTGWHSRMVPISKKIHKLIS